MVSEKLILEEVIKACTRWAGTMGLKKKGWFQEILRRESLQGLVRVRCKG